MNRVSRFRSMGVCARVLGLSLLTAIIFISGCTTSGNSETQLAVGTLSAGLPAGSVSGSAYPATALRATGGTAPYVWTSTGNLPAGLTLSSSGMISGTPTTSGTSNFTVTVTDSATPAHTATANLSITINSKLTITSAGTLSPTGTAGFAYAPSALAATGGVGPFTWVVNSGALPNGLALSSSGGAISGTISSSAKPGSFDFTAKITDSQGATATSSTITINVIAAPSVTSFAPAALTITAGKTTSLTAVFAGGTGSVSNGVGAVTSGTPVNVSPSATTNYTLTVTNSAGAAVTAQATVTVVAAPVITSFTPAAATITTGTSTTLTGVFTGGAGSVNNSIGAVTSGTPASTGTLSATTTYTLTVTNAAGASVTAQATVTVVPPPIATSLTPGSATITAGSSTTLTALFSNGTGSINNGVGTVTSGTTVNVTPAVTTTYTLTVTNTAGTTATTQTTVTVVAAPTITSFTPAAATITLGSSTTLTGVFGGGTGTVDHAVGAVTTGTPVTVTPLVTTTYTLTVSNGGGSSVTKQTTVAVVPAPIATGLTPGSATITAGTSTTLTGVFSNGTGSISNGVGAVVSGTPVNVTPAATTTYTLTVTNAAGTTATTQATVTVVAAPVITGFTPGSATITTGNSDTLTAVFSGGTGSINNGIGTVTSGTSANTGALAATTTYTLTVTNTAGASVTAQATVTVVATPVITSFTPGSATIISGSSTTLTAVFTGGTGSIDNGIGAVTSGTLVNISPSVTTTYKLTVVNAATTPATATATATVTVNSPPTVTQNPANQTVGAGGNATFTAAASGSPAPTVQWQVSTNGGVAFTNIGGATSTTLTLMAVTVGQSGNLYQAVFTNSVGNITTSAASLTVNTGAAITSNPSNQTVIAGNNATFTAAATGTPAPTVQWQVSVSGGPFTNIAGATSTTLTVTAVTTPQNGNQYQAVFTNSVGSATTTPATLTVDFAPVITQNPTNQSVAAGSNATFTATANGNSPPTVQWQVSTGGGPFTNIGGATSTTLTLTAVTIGQSGNLYQAVFTNSVSTVTSLQAKLTVTAAPVVTLNPANQTVTAGSNATFTAAASGTPAPTVQWQVSVSGGPFTNINGATSTTLSLTAVNSSQNGNQYAAVFTNSTGNATTTPATLAVDFGPVVTQSPVNQSVVAGNNAIFTATANGNPLPTVQWQVSTDNGLTFSNVSGATSTTLSLTAVNVGQNGNIYQAVFTNSVSTATTASAKLTVTNSPLITLSPVNQTITAGNNATFTAGASGTPAPTVQWQVSVNGGAFTNIGGATATTLTLTAVTGAQNGNRYQAVFTNSSGTATTSAATLTVNAPPAITSSNSTTFTAGVSGTFSVTATGFPTPAISEVGSLPASVTFVDNGNGTATISGTPTNAQAGVYPITITASNGVGTNATQSFTLSVVVPSCATNCTISGTVSGPSVPGPWVYGITVAISGGPTTLPSTTTDSNGFYSFAGLAGGIYTVTPSLAGYSYSPASPSVATVNSTTTQDFVASSTMISYSISGKVSYGGTKTGVTYIRVFPGGCTNCNSVAGTSIPTAPSSSGTPYTINGLAGSGGGGNGNGTYTVTAEIDTLGKGSPNASDPTGSTPTTITINSANVPGQDFTVFDRTAPAPLPPTKLNVSGGSQMALVQYKGAQDSNGEEIATSYKIYYSTSPTFATVNSVTFTARGNHDNGYILHGLTNGIIYLKMSAFVGAAESATSSVVGPITIGPNTSGTFSVSGTVTFPGTATGPMYAGVYDNNTGNIWIQTIPTPFTSGVSYNVTGVPNGVYQNFAIIDMNNDGSIDVGDLQNVNGNSNGPQVTVNNSNVIGSNMILSAAGTSISLSTFHQRFSGDSYGLNFGIADGTKLPVSVVLFSGNNVAVPFDLGSDTHNNYSAIYNSLVRPVVNDNYQLLITFSDGTTQIVSVPVTVVLDAFATNLAMNSPVNSTPPMGATTATVPMLNWVAPVTHPASYTYNVGLSNAQGNPNQANWYYSGGNNSNGIPSTQLNVQYNFDNNAHPPALVTGNYNWWVTVQDANGNSAQVITTYNVP